MQDQEFWHSRWAENRIGFHLEDVNPLLPKFWPQLAPTNEQSVLVPLCGKSEDLIWLANQHSSVTGVELSNIAVRSFFAEHFYTPMVASLNGQHELYQFDELSIFAGDFFTAPLETYDLIYDRAALIALPPAIRLQYVQRIRSVLNSNGKILLIGLDYVQSEMQGPPFSVPENEIAELFSGMKITRLNRDEASANHPKIQNGLSRFAEEVWLIER
ncbi:thiopurine S-methyltransferase [Vibrio rumoiensis]|uniref:Thiopurine S-methyltransferase n=1 Tax=Vibrio rumoiensis 1S-45 TaxID=1188252 RepID=A0A1E5E1L3_9VIBR|nr:thiopurine S-methyltransferase [Vibrio rumoiensis]OEF24122.1 thiopurine S-methyltransferase [Vibrio rumoiensis 1S-45]